MSAIDELVSMKNWEAHRGHPFYMDFVGDGSSADIREAAEELSAIRARLAAQDARIEKLEDINNAFIIFANRLREEGQNNSRRDIGSLKIHIANELSDIPTSDND